MKKILTTAIAAAALLSIASCQKENLEIANGDSSKTVRIISAEFVNDGTKTTLGANDTPMWAVGNVIRVLDGTGYQDITLTSSNIDNQDASKITFSTTLTGSTLYAVYPASAIAMTKCTDGNITFTIPAIQDGTFGSANICVASGDGASIYFSNATAVVEMSVASTVVGAQFAATNKVAGDMTVAMGTNGAISSTTTTSLSSSSISVSDTKAPAGNKFYLAVAPVETGAVTVTCNTTTKSGSIDKGTKTLAKDKIYAMNLSSMNINTDFDLTGQHGIQNGREYVIIKAKYNGTDDSYLKWATQNLAVTDSGRAKWNSTNYVIGDYFQWAASYAGYGITTDADKIPSNLVIYDSFTTTNTGGASNAFSFNGSKQFTIASAPYYNGSAYTKYTGTSGDGKTVLEQSDDVANIVLGGTWRIPTGGSDGELKAMKEATVWTWDDTDKGYYVTKSSVSLASDKSNALLFFPAAGCGYNNVLYYAGDYGYRWSSTLKPGNLSSSGYAYSLDFYSSLGVYPDAEINRYYGYSVRPVSD